MEAQIVDLLATLALLRRQLRLIVLCVAVVLTAAGLLLATTQPLYSATALVRVNATRTDLLAATSALPVDATGIEDDVELGKSVGEMHRVAFLLDLAHDPEFAPHLGFPATLFPGLFAHPAATPEAIDAGIADRLRDAVQVERRDGASTLALTATAHRPDLAAALANALAEALIAGEREQRVAAIAKARDMARGQLAEANATLTAAEAAIDHFVATTVAADAQTTGPADRIADQLRLATTATGADAVAARAALPPATRAELDGLLQAAGTARAQYQALVAVDGKLTAEADLQVDDIVGTSTAQAPLTPVWPNWRLILTLAGLVGLTLGVCLAFLNDGLFGGFTSTEQLAALGQPIGTALPHLRPTAGTMLPMAVPADALRVAPLSGFAEAVRRLPIAIDAAVRRQRQASTLPARKAGSCCW